MTIVLDKELVEWLDNEISLEITEPKLKDGAPDEIKNKFEEWLKIRNKYEISWNSNN